MAKTPRRTKQERHALAKRVDAAIRADVLTDRLGIQPLGPGRERTELRWVAWLLIVAIYGTGWGMSTVYAVVLLVWPDSANTAGTYTLPDFFMALGSDAIVLSLAVVGICLFAKPRPTRPAPSTGIQTFLVYCLLPALVLYAAACLADVAGLHWYSSETEYAHPWLVAVDAFDTAMAGPTEELALLALPVIALRRVGYSWTVVCATAALLRVPFHLYYSWTALLFVAWAVGAVFLYRRTGAIAAIVLAHSLHNALVTLDSALPGLGYGTHIFEAGGGVVIFFYAWRQRRKALAEDECA